MTNEPNNLSLVPLEDLLSEVEGRCTNLVVAYSMPKDHKSMMYFKYGKGDWSGSVQLAAILNNDVLNNWNGELRVLQRIAEDSDEE